MEPRIGTSVGGIPKIIKPGSTGFLVKSNDAIDLTNSWICMHNNSALFDRSFIKYSTRTQYSWDKTAKVFLDVVSKFT